MTLEKEAMKTMVDDISHLIELTDRFGIAVSVKGLIANDLEDKSELAGIAFDLRTIDDKLTEARDILKRRIRLTGGNNHVRDN